MLCMELQGNILILGTVVTVLLHPAFSNHVPGTVYIDDLCTLYM
jgi:hypothetical protein